MRFETYGYFEISVFSFDRDTTALNHSLKFRKNMVRKIENNSHVTIVNEPTRRSLLKGVGVASVWSTPIVSSIVLPAHAQTSAAICITDRTVGGPLAGNASGATTCQAACEFEAASEGAELCDVREISTGSGTDCSCDLDLPSS